MMSERTFFTLFPLSDCGLDFCYYALGCEPERASEDARERSEDQERPHHQRESMQYVLRDVQSQGVAAACQWPLTGRYFTKLDFRFWPIPAVHNPAQ
jgi:hypothetical protein